MSRKRKLDRLDDERLSNQFGRRVRECRTNLGLTQKELAGRIGVPAQYVSMIETGSSANPTLRLIVLLADALEVPTSELLMDIDSRIEHGSTISTAELLAELWREAPPSAKELAIRLLENWPKAG